MITKEDEYKAQVFQIVGLAFMSPFGRIILDPVSVFNSFGIFFFTGYLIFAILLTFVGLILIDKGRDTLDEREKIK